MKTFTDWFNQKLKQDRAYYYYGYHEVCRIFNQEYGFNTFPVNKREFRKIKKQFKKTEIRSNDPLQKTLTLFFTKNVKTCLLSYGIVQLFLITTALTLGVETIDDKGVVFSEISMVITFPICMLLFIIFPIPVLATGEEYWEIYLLFILVPLGAIQYIFIGKMIDYSKELKMDS